MKLCAKHDWVEIMRVPQGYDTDKTVNWCRNCGTLATDDYVDGRYMNERKYIPQYLKEEGNAK